jgi:Bacterial Ig-like domain (group 2)
MKNAPFRLIGYFFIVILTATLTLVPACTSVPNPEATSGVTLASIKVSMASNSSLANALRVFFDIFNPAIKEYMDYPATMSIGSKAQFVAVGTYSDTAYSAVTSQVSWSSSNTAVATISVGGLVSAVANGTTNITATLSGIASPSLVLTVGSPNSTSSSDLSIAKFAPFSVSSQIANNKGIDYSTGLNRN